MRPNLTLIRNTTLNKQYWPLSKSTVVRVMSQEATTVSFQDEKGTRVEVYTKFGPVVIEIQ